MNCSFQFNLTRSKVIKVGKVCHLILPSLLSSLQYGNSGQEVFSLFFFFQKRKKKNRNNKLGKCYLLCFGEEVGWIEPFRGREVVS